MNEFEIKPYPFGQLAQMYYPGHNYQSALAEKTKVNFVFSLAFLYLCAKVLRYYRSLRKYSSQLDMFSLAYSYLCRGFNRQKVWVSRILFVNLQCQSRICLVIFAALSRVNLRYGKIMGIYICCSGTYEKH